MSAFSVFNNCTVKVGHINASDGYVDDDNEFIEDAAFEADFQPYNGGLAQKEYGVEEEVTARIYTESTDGKLKSDMIAAIHDTKYDVIYVAVWEFGEVALLRQRKD